MSVSIDFNLLNGFGNITGAPFFDSLFPVRKTGGVSIHAAFRKKTCHLNDVFFSFRPSLKFPVNRPAVSGSQWGIIDRADVLCTSQKVHANFVVAAGLSINGEEHLPDGLSLS